MKFLLVLHNNPAVLDALTPEAQQLLMDGHLAFIETTQKSGELIVVDSVAQKEAKTAALKASFGKLEWSNALIIDGETVDTNFALAARNIPQIDVLPVQGINVVDILRRQKLVLTKAALEALEARFA